MTEGISEKPKAEKIESFTDLIVWQKAQKMFIETTKDTELFRKTTASVITSKQLLRALSSISANIAEGFGRQKGKEFCRFLIIGRGSVTESEDWLIKCKDLELIDKETFKKRFNPCEEIRLMLNSIIGKLRSGK